MDTSDSSSGPSDSPELAPLIDVLVAYYAAIQDLHERERHDPVVRMRLHMALDSILDGSVVFGRKPPTPR